MVYAVFFVSVATIVVPACSGAHADSACIEQPGQPAAEGARWLQRYDRAKGRRCWVLVDASGHDVTVSQAQPSAPPAPALDPTFSSQLAALFGSWTAQANVAPPGNPPQINSASASRKPQGAVANANKPDSGLRSDQKSSREGHAGKRTAPVLSEQERNALFEEFMRWHESQQSITLRLAPRASP
jgi:hypothetical protein